MISNWATKFNIKILSPTVMAGSYVYRIKDIFTTRDGSWEPSSKEGSIEQWARDTYIRAYGSPNYFDDAGGDHHLFGGVYDPIAKEMKKDVKIFYYTWTDNANDTLVPVKPQSGWANNVIYNSFNPDMDLDPNTGRRGAWAWTVGDGSIPADTVLGGGMPFKWHVSFFATWVLETAEEPSEPGDDLEEIVQNLVEWAIAVSLANPEEPQYGHL